MRTYWGTRGPGGTCRVMVVDDDGVRGFLDPCTDVFNHSPDGFEWGYQGSGPAQLALALCVDQLGREGEALEIAVRVHQRFKRRVVALLGRDHWNLTGDFVAAVIVDLEHPAQLTLEEVLRGA